MKFTILTLLAFASMASLFVRSAKGEDVVAPTYSSSIASIIYSHCSHCHRNGQSAPFNLLSYQEVVEHSQTISAVLKSNYMPPWKPEEHGLPFANDRRLRQTELNEVLKWIDAGCPKGDADKIPEPPKFTEGWSLGKPDLIVKLQEPFQIPADGPDLYRSFVFPLGLAEDRWIKAMELRPTARSAVHHALFFIDVGGGAKSLRSPDGQPGFVGMNFLKGRGNPLERLPDGMARGLGGYVPGAVPNRLPGDLARLLPIDSDIVMQTHFHPTGKPEVEQGELGIYFAEKAPPQSLISVQIPPLFGMGAGIDIPPGKADFHIHESFKLPIGIRGIEIGGHAHYICTRMSMEAKLPDGSSKMLLAISDWDLDWQDQYQFADPVLLPEGTELIVDIYYDNSTANPENPYSPPQRITWGRESNDEMGSITLLAVAEVESERAVLEKALRTNMRASLANRIRSQLGIVSMLGGNAGNGSLLKLFDQNGDGKLDRDELPKRGRDRLLDLFDTDGDEQISSDEIELGRENVKKFLDEVDSEKKQLPGANRFFKGRKPISVQTVNSDVSVSDLPIIGNSDRVTVLVFVRTDCPIANAYQPKLQRLRKEFGDDQFRWIMVYPQAGADPRKLEQHAKEFGIDYEQILDPEHRLVEWAKAKVTPQAVVLTKDNEVVYRGRIDDLHAGYGKKRAAAMNDDLKDVLKKIRDDVEVQLTETEPVGCVIVSKKKEGPHGHD